MRLRVSLSLSLSYTYIHSILYAHAYTLSLKFTPFPCLSPSMHTHAHVPFPHLYTHTHAKTLSPSLTHALLSNARTLLPTHTRTHTHAYAHGLGTPHPSAALHLSPLLGIHLRPGPGACMTRGGNPSSRICVGPRRRAGRDSAAGGVDRAPGMSFQGWPGPESTTRAPDWPVRPRRSSTRSKTCATMTRRRPPTGTRVRHRTSAKVKGPRLKNQPAKRSVCVEPPWLDAQHPWHASSFSLDVSPRRIQ